MAAVICRECWVCYATWWFLTFFSFGWQPQWGNGCSHNTSATQNAKYVGASTARSTALFTFRCVVYTDGISLCVNLIIKKPRCRKSDFPSSVRAQGLLPINTLILSFFFLFCAPTHTLNLPFRFAAVRDYRRKDDLLCYAMYGLEAKSWCDLTARAQGDSFWLN